MFFYVVLLQGDINESEKHNKEKVSVSNCFIRIACCYISHSKVHVHIDEIHHFHVRSMFSYSEQTVV